MLNKYPFARSLVFVCLLASLWRGTLMSRAADTSIVKKGKIPFTVYDEKGSTNNHYVASGWMGTVKGLKMDDGCTTNAHSGKYCVRFEYGEPDDWAGIVWQDPADDWGDLPGGWNLTGAKKLSFWARGEKGGETATFKYGILGQDKNYADSSSGEINDVKLTVEWKKYTIELDGKDLSRIKTSFVCTVRGQGAPVVFFLDDIRYE